MRQRYAMTAANGSAADLVRMPTWLPSGLCTLLATGKEDAAGRAWMAVGSGMQRRPVARRLERVCLSLTEGVAPPWLAGPGRSTVSGVEASLESLTWDCNLVV